MATHAITGELADETPLAWKFVPDGCEEDDATWCPKSICEWIADEEDGIQGTMNVPEWFAHKEGLI